MPVFIIADFSIIIFALGLFIFFWAALPLIVATGEGIASIVRGFPAIGDDLADWIRARTHDVERTVQDTMESAVHAGTQPFVDLMNGYANTRRVESYSQRNVMQNIVGWVAQVAHAQQHQVTQPVVDTVNHTVTNNVENTNNYITQVVGVNQQYVDESLSQSYSWAEAGFAAVYTSINQLASDVNDTIRWAQGEFSAANDYAQTVSGQARDEAVSTANDYTQTAFTTLETYVSQTVDWVQSTIAANQEWTTGEVNRGIDDVTKIASGLTTLVMENVVPRVAEIEQDIEKCVRPLCDNGLDFVKGLGQLEDILSMAKLFGVIVDAVTDPEGTGKAIAHEVDEITALPRELFAAITGIGK